MGALTCPRCHLALMKGVIRFRASAMSPFVSWGGSALRATFVEGGDRRTDILSQSQKRLAFVCGKCYTAFIPPA